MKGLSLTAFALLILAGCGRQETPEKSPWAEAASPADTRPLPEARQGFKTKPVARRGARTPAPMPPPELFRLVRYNSPVGPLPAYLSVTPKDGKRRPAIIWITGGDCNSIDQGCWQEGPPSNDQSASAFRKAGIVMMFPSLRGGNDNPGVKEGYFGEVDDVLAAADYLAQQDFVDPQRLYLGGHSTGGTVALLTAESTDRFRAVFSFGPVDDVGGYPPQYLPFDISNPKELELRAPVRWLHSVRSPVFVFEGTGGNILSLVTLSTRSHNPLVHCHQVKGGDHFSILRPVTRLLASKVLADDGPTTNITVTEAELANRH
jgi:hypothetical protein